MILAFPSPFPTFNSYRSLGLSLLLSCTFPSRSLPFPSPFPSPFPTFPIRPGPLGPVGG